MNKRPASAPTGCKRPVGFIAFTAHLRPGADCRDRPPPAASRRLTSLFHRQLPVAALLLCLSAPLAAAEPMYGLNFSPFMDGQGPGSTLTDEQLNARLTLIRSHTRWIRSFSTTHGMAHIGALAHRLGLKVAMGAWISSDLNANRQEIANLIAAARNGEADLLIVGSEVLQRAESTPPADPLPDAERLLTGYLEEVKQAVPANIPVSYADTYQRLLAHPKLLAACRGVVMANFYPYWEAQDVRVAMADLHHKYLALQAASGGKRVLVSEAGWPDAGDSLGAAVANADTAAFYLRDFLSWARANRVGYFYYAAFDEKWKAANAPAAEAHWGIFDSAGRLKPGAAQALAAPPLADNWRVIGGKGKPELVLADHPAPAGGNKMLHGRVWHVEPSRYRLAVFAEVNGQWRPQPDWPAPDHTGSFALALTGGDYAQATRLQLFLVPARLAVGSGYAVVRRAAVAGLGVGGM